MERQTEVTCLGLFLNCHAGFVRQPRILTTHSIVKHQQGANGMQRDLLITRQLVRYGKKPGYWAKLRCSGEGPVYMKVGKTVLYDPVDVEAWLSKKRRRSTSDPGCSDER